jgi:hypothetical protein
MASMLVPTVVITGRSWLIVAKLVRGIEHGVSNPPWLAAKARRCDADTGGDIRCRDGASAPRSHPCGLAGLDGLRRALPTTHPGIRTICFEPNPGTTQGEGEYVAALARRNDWHSLLIVAIRPQAVRARLIFGRCFSGQVYVSTAPLAAGSWPYQIAYGWGALVKAVLVNTGC